MFQIDFSKVLQLLQFDKRDPLLFGSSLFLALFIGVLLVLFILDKYPKAKFLFLTLFSFYFYYKASNQMIWLLLTMAVVNYGLGVYIRKNSIQWIKRLLMLTGVLANLGALVYFKYTNFILSSISQFNNQPFEALPIIVPLGISFYVFKSISYVMDSYWEFFEEEHSFLDFVLYLSFFPSILAGPIDRATAFIPQLKNNPSTLLTKEDIGKALFLIVMGLMKKYVVADYIGLNLVDRVFDSPLRFTGVENLIALYGYALQIYCDFSGYTDMAIGIALLMGFRLMENFNYPYKAKSIAEFWRRWHISLSSWLQDYLFKPIQMSARSLKIFGNILAVAITFLLCGLWHGASWNFLIWGGLHAFFMIVSLLLKTPRKYLLEKSGLGKLKITGFVQTVIAFHLIMFAWLFFRLPDLNAVKEVLTQMITFFRPAVAPQFVEAYPVITVLIIAGYLLHFLPQKFYGACEGVVIKAPVIVKALIVTLAILIVTQFRFADMVPFIYFQF
ncbi:MAG: MBOAT family protein [Ignavibacteriales bacterium]|nr:MBOAT family protein [Ignavibacteriales bacterium]